jgi:hypothetical protein
MKKYITSNEAEFIAEIEIFDSALGECQCGKADIMIIDEDEFIICDECANSQNK